MFYVLLNYKAALNRCGGVMVKALALQFGGRFRGRAKPTVIYGSRLEQKLLTLTNSSSRQEEVKDVRTVVIKKQELIRFVNKWHTS